MVEQGFRHRQADSRVLECIFFAERGLIYMFDAVCGLPTWLCGSYPLECQVLHELDLFHYITSFLVVVFFFNARGNGLGSIDEFLETAAVCLNKALFSIPKILAHRPSSQPFPPGASFPAVPVCLYPGSCRAGSSLTLGFSSLELICPQVNSK